MLPFEILYEDAHIIAVNKPSGYLTEGRSKSGKKMSKTVAQQVLRYLKQQRFNPRKAFVGVPHRLDRRVSGVLLLARTPKALSALNALFQQGAIQKTYWAVVKAAPPEKAATLTHFLVKNQAKNKSKAFGKPLENAKKAVLEYKQVASSDRYVLLEVHPKTGRHHQIRAQLAAINCPIKGDIKYGFKRTNRDSSIHLHAHKLNFVHPILNKPIEISVMPPEEVLWQVLTAQLPTNSDSDA
jgi:23S rRNA pseudouridine1911/1915/1917 synthase